ncbi:hypothetical protein MOQ_004222 [Trypanosoma cruzi marinkellei]|uniref:Trans-sialidase n=1 Tax=Trypanosoma cruzi marinkellei TaxID=85056 RepID=K2MXT2_TRYCR|nr:hypothetical protein MOQ_004222 [Trypanosoma cruzi marinkellei]
MWRRVVFFSASLTVALRHTHRLTVTRTRTSTPNLSSGTATLWWDGAAAAEQVPLATVEEMFGRMEGDDYDEKGDKIAPHPATASLRGGRDAVEEEFFEWLDDENNSAAAGTGDLSLEGVMNAALAEPRPGDERNASDEIGGNSDTNNSDSVRASYGNGAGGSEGRAVSRMDDTLEGEADDDDDDDGVAAAGGPDVLFDDNGGNDELEDDAYDVEDEDASAIPAEEEEDQVEQLFRATQTSESTAALFFKDKQRVVKGTAATPSFDDAAAEGAELEIVGEVMPSPKRL